MFLNISDFDYHLPNERIAKYPVNQRDKSKLLIYKNSAISQSEFWQIADFLPEKALLVCNDTRVIHARLLFEKQTGAHIEIFCLEPFAPADYSQSLASVRNCEWKCMVGNLKKWKNAEILHKKLIINDLKIDLSAKIVCAEGNAHRVGFEWNNAAVSFAEILEAAGELPIPPYLHRRTETSDLTDYQTVYALHEGSVAAPTAGLHFTQNVFSSLEKNMISQAKITLHVGAGTFLPVKTENALEHPMHAEVFSVKRTEIEKLQQNLGRIVAVGTTTLRTLESLYFIGCQIDESKNEHSNFFVEQHTPYEKNYTLSAKEALQRIVNYLDCHKQNELRARTQIMIRPSYKFQIVNALITNFHQPKSTLLLLVAAFAGEEKWREIYRYALAHDFRFLSYGDSSLLVP